MASKTCGECRFYNEDYNFCLHWRYEDITAGSDVCNYFALPTNRDRLRRMSNEELATAWSEEAFLFEWCYDCMGYCKDGNTPENRAKCKKRMLDWLNAPAKEGEDE